MQIIFIVVYKNNLKLLLGKYCYPQVCTRDALYRAQLIGPFKKNWVKVPGRPDPYQLRERSVFANIPILVEGIADRKIEVSLP